jgi:hypothetical protein
MKNKKPLALLFLILSIGLVAGCDHIADTDLVGYAYPSVANVAAMSHSRETYGLPLNAPLHNRELVDHRGASGVVSPNNDTLYSGLSIDLSESPQIIELPPIDEGRYQSMMITDMRAYNVAEFVNNGMGGRYMFAVNGYQGDVPDDVEFVEAESDVLLGIIRTEVFDAADLPKVHRIQDQIRITPLLPIDNNLTVSPDLPVIDPENLEMSVLDNWVEMAQWAMKHSPKLDARDAQYKAQIEQLEPGLLNKLMFAYGVYKLKKAGAQMKSTQGYYGPRDQVTDNHWERGAINTFSHLALSYERALYPTYTTDRDGDELVGCQAYTITFRDVPVRAFWSFTVYQTQNKQFVPNDDNKYRVSDKSAIQGADGSITIHLGGDPVANNYLPLPADCAPWYSLIRLYEPEESLLNETWQVPQIVKAN